MVTFIEMSSLCTATCWLQKCVPCDLRCQREEREHIVNYRSDIAPSALRASWCSSSSSDNTTSTAMNLSGGERCNRKLMLDSLLLWQKMAKLRAAAHTRKTNCGKSGSLCVRERALYFIFGIMQHQHRHQPHRCHIFPSSIFCSSFGWHFGNRT